MDSSPAYRTAFARETDSGSNRMKPQNFFSPLRWLGRLVLLLMAVAVTYAGYISITYWPGIAV